MNTTETIEKVNGVLQKHSNPSRLEYDDPILDEIWGCLGLDDTDVEGLEVALELVGFERSNVSYCYLKEEIE